MAAVESHGTARIRSRSPLRDVKPLSDAEVEEYHREGWLVPKVSVQLELIEKLRNTLDKLIEQNPDVRPERLVSAHLDENPSKTEGVKGSTDFFELAFHPTIVAAVSQLIGPDFALWGCQVFCKPGGDGMEVPMHQDGHYWPIRPLATITAWVALDNSDVGNGCLRVLPQSHRSKRNYEHHKSDDPKLVLNQAITDEELQHLEGPADVELTPGQFSLHDVYTVHGSKANTSVRRRAGVAFRYMPTTSVMKRDLFPSDASSGYTVDWANRPLFLVSGTDRSGQNSLSPLPRGVQARL